MDQKTHTIGHKEKIEKEIKANEMPIDYSKLGFRCGLEIHQQLETSKLFCNCPSANTSSKPSKIVMRRLRAVAGETGKVDVSAEHEQKKGKFFLYQYSSENCCLVELDEEPPRPLNKEALDIAVKAALLLNMKLVDEVQTMRKMVVDGSNTTGFQRTSLIARDGYVETPKGKVTIQTLCLEEESAQVIERGESCDTYNLSRLGIPLIEIATGSEIKDPLHAMELAEKLGMILRSLPKIKRGIGTIRQDVNLSIKGAPRVEIKGFQDLKSMPKVIEFEVKRQIHAVEKKEKLVSEVRKAEPDFTTSFMRPMPGADRMYPETDVWPIVIDKTNIELPELIEDRAKRFASEFGLNAETAKLAAKEHLDIALYAKRYKNVKPQFVADYFLSVPKEIKRRFEIEVDVKKYAHEIFEKLDLEQIPKEAVLEILVDYSKHGKVDYSKYKASSSDEIESEIKAIVDSNPGKSQGALMGMAMAKFRGKVDGKKISEALTKLMKN